MEEPITNMDDAVGDDEGRPFVAVVPSTYEIAPASPRAGGCTLVEGTDEEGKGGVDGTSRLDDVLSAVGVELFSFVSPRDLVSMSLVDRHFEQWLHRNLFLVHARQLLSESGHGAEDVEGATSPVVISNKHSFATKEELGECLLQKIQRANLRYDPPYYDDAPSHDSLQATLAMVREDMAGEWEDGSWYGIFRNDPCEIWKPYKKPSSMGVTFRKELNRGRSRQCHIDMMLRQVKVPESSAGRNRRDWARYIIARRGIVGREWSCKCDGKEEVGFMIHVPGSGTEMEIRFTKEANELECSGPSSSPTSFSLLSTFGLSRT